MDLYEFEASLACSTRASSKTARATQRNPVSKNKTKPHTNSSRIYEFNMTLCLILLRVSLVVLDTSVIPSVSQVCELVSTFA